ncbi:MAG TPA: ABC-type transport auxiliary lipoprotein family protein [Acetobacteraceae bacterium]|nr:ABC-type transport auxiliary lipoprotein family protein [Acetobacteraceae bacterium]
MTRSPLPRRALMGLALPGLLGIAACSVLPERPYQERREWPLMTRRPGTREPPQDAPTLLIRSLAAAPGLRERGLLVLQPDGSVQVGYWDEWAVFPADGVEDGLRQWLTDSGLFNAVLAPGSRSRADLVLEGELTDFVADPRAGVARAALAIVLLRQSGGGATVLFATTLRATAPLAGTATATVAAAQLQALAGVYAQVEQRLAPVARGKGQGSALDPLGP